MSRALVLVSARSGGRRAERVSAEEKKNKKNKNEGTVNNFVDDLAVFHR